ncbi:nucleotidyltransferase family protein [bacterium]|nr:nucleotidyltransferase family protein [bacterium]
MIRELKDICIGSDLPIKDAVKILNKGHCRIVLVVDEDNRLEGVVADPDIRRAILNGLSFNLPVNEIMVTEPVVSSLDMDKNSIFALMQSAKCYEIPILDHNKKVVGLRTIDAFIGQKLPANVVVMAGGLGNRLMELTKVTPKPLLPINGKPILFIILDQLIVAGFERITLALNYKADMVIDAVNSVPGYKDLVDFIIEKKRLGTGGPLSLLENPSHSSFFVINADLLTNVDFEAMLRFHEVEGNHLTMAIREEGHRVAFGVVELEGSKVLGIEEKPIKKYFINAGIYVVDHSMLRFVPKNSFYDMPDLIRDLISHGKQVGSFPIHEYWLDIGRYDELEKAQKDAKFI